MIEITCLVDNTVQRGSRLWGEHGVSFWIATEAGRVLFDTGGSGTVLLHNMDVLGLDPHTLDALAISHAHYDHTGGLPALLEQIDPRLPLYAHPDLFRERFSLHQGQPTAIGMPPAREALAAQAALSLSDRPQEICPGVWTTGEILDRRQPEGRSAGHFVQAADGWTPDPYRDDMSLVVEIPAGLVLLCGCCHAGLLNTLAQVGRTLDRPVAVIAGGTHLAGAGREHLQRVADTMSRMKALRRVYLNHCSGEEAAHVLWQALGGDVVRPCPAGTRLELGGWG